MSKTLVACFGVAIALGLVLLYSGGVRAQSGTRRPATSVPSQERKPPSPAEFQKQLWDYVSSKYKTWVSWPGKPGVQEGNSPHGAFVRMYVNEAVAKNPKNPPEGSIIVKENYGKDKKTMMALTVMYRSRGYDPKHDDWYWIKYNADGAVDKAPREMGGMPLAGRVSGCIDCHSGAESKDFIFAND